MCDADVVCVPGILQVAAGVMSPVPQCSVLECLIVCAET